MTSITAWRKFATHRIIYVGIAALFALGMVVYFGSGPSGKSDSGRYDAGAAIATVNDEPISRAEYASAWEMQRSQYGLLGGNDSRAASLQGMLLGQLADMALVRSMARKRNLEVDDDAVETAITEMRTQLGSKDKPATDEDLMRAMRANTMDEVRETMERRLLVEAFATSLGSAKKLTEADLQKTYEQAKLRHILIAVAGGKASAPGALPDAQAKHRAEQVLAKVKAGGDFADLANEYTMDPSNKAPSTDPKTKRPTNDLKGGLMEMAPLTRYVPEFAEAARKLKPGEVSGLVKTDFGYHIIKMEEFKRELPADYAKNKANLLNNLRRQKGAEELEKLLAEARPKAKVKWIDPTLEWRYEMGRMYSSTTPDADPAKAQEKMIAKLTEHLKKQPDDSAAGLVLGQMLYSSKYLSAGPPKPAGAGSAAADTERNKVRDQIIDAYTTALKGAEDTNVRFTVAELHLDAGQKDKALEQYKRIARLLSYDDSPDNRWMHQRLVGAFTKLGQADLAAEQQKKLDAIAVIEKRRADEKKAEDARVKAEAAKVAAQKKIDDAKLEALRKQQGAAAPKPGGGGLSLPEGAVELPPGGSATAGGTKPANPGAPPAPSSSGQ